MLRLNKSSGGDDKNIEMNSTVGVINMSGKQVTEVKSWY